MSEEKPPEVPEEKPSPKWEYKTEFGINTKLREVVEKTVAVTTHEVDSLRRKLDRLTYGS